MRIYINPTEEEITDIIARPSKDWGALSVAVGDVLQRVQSEGDDAVIDCERQFDHVDLSAVSPSSPLKVTENEFQRAEQIVSPELKAALTSAHSNIARFHEAQRFVDVVVDTQPGVRCWQRSVPIESVGLYVPGGTAPLFSTVLMLATPARIAGCRRIVLCTPPCKDGSVHPAILVAARIAGVSDVFKAGGVQAIGAMAYGTKSIPRVSKIFGPGNQYVQAAKQLVALSQVAIDMPAGPSEVLVIADESAVPSFVAADLLSQAEHGTDSQVLLLTNHEPMLAAVQDELSRQLAVLPRREMAEATLLNSRLVYSDSLQTIISIANAYAPEHLILEAADADRLAELVVNAGSVFIGHLTPESAGDYASGTNHTLPTNGWAKAYSGVNLDSFCRKITFQKISEEGLPSLAPIVETMAEAEGLDAHRMAMALRRQRLAKP
ncbi:MAG: histidinol dehydrogenase [Bacteroidaceae bacterium]|nr:histidinol dehydrogenase [Bacteroidaceae bacterium]